MTETEIYKYEDIYDALIKRLQKVKSTYWVITTYPHHPPKGENPKRDRYFEFHEHFAQENTNIEFKRIVTITHRSKYLWVKDLIEKFRDHPKYSIGYIDIGKNCLPFLGIMIFDKEEVFLTAVTEPKSEALFIRSRDNSICKFFTHYFEKSWEQFCVKLKDGLTIFRKNLEELEKLLQRPNIMENNMNKEPIQWVKAAVVQLNLTEYIKTQQYGVCVIKDEQKNALKEKIEKILDFCANKNCDIVIFPEYSTYKDLVSIFREISLKRNMVIVGGSFYDNTTQKNVSPIVIEGNCYFTEKVHPSPYQMSPYSGLGVKPGINIHLFRKTHVGSFAVIICLDYLERMVMDEIFSRGDVDFIIVCALNNNSDRFFSKMQWDCEQSTEGFYILYSNCIAKINNETIGDGRTSIWGVMDKRYLRNKAGFPYNIKTIDFDGDGIIIANFDRKNKKPPAVPIPSRYPNIRDIAVFKVKVDKDENIYIEEMK